MDPATINHKGAPGARHSRTITLDIDTAVLRLLENEAREAKVTLPVHLNRVLRALVGLEDLVGLGRTHTAQPEAPQRATKRATAQPSTRTPSARIVKPKKRGLGALSYEERCVIAAKAAETRRRNRLAAEMALHARISAAAGTRRKRPA